MGGPRVCRVIPGALGRAACARIVRAVTPSFAAAAMDYPPSYRDNDRAVVDDPELARALFARLSGALPERVVGADGSAWRLVALNERFRFCRYAGGQSFRIHRDGAHAESATRRSLLTLQIYLDEGFEGGRTRFYASRRGPLTHAIEARVGRAIVFEHDDWHDGEAVTRGTKHVLRTDLVYERTAAPVETAKEGVTVLEGHEGYVFSLLALSGGAIVSGSRDRTLRRWARDEAAGGGDSATGWRCTRVLRGHDASVLALAEPSPGVVWSGSRDRTIREWDLARGTSRVVETLGGAVLCLASLGDGRVAAGTGDATVAIARERRALVGHAGWVWALAPLGSGLLASGSEDATIRVWDVASGECVASASPGRGPVHALAALADGTLAAGFADGHVIVYALDRARESLAPLAVHRANDGEVYAVCPSGDRLVTGGEDDTAHVIARDGARIASLPHHDFVRAIARLDDGALVTGSYDARVRVWAAAPRLRASADTGASDETYRAASADTHGARRRAPDDANQPKKPE